MGARAFELPLCVSAPGASVIRPGMFAIGADLSQHLWRLRLQLLHAFFIGLAKVLLAEGFRLGLEVSLILAHRFPSILVRLLALLLAVAIAVLRIRI